MRIGLFTDMYLPHVSGVTNHVRLYKKHYEDLGHEVFLFTFGNTGYADAEPNVIRNQGVPWGETGWRFALSFSADARRIVPTLDVAHVHHPFQSGVLTLALCRKHGIPVVMTNHTRYDLYADEYARWAPAPLRHGFLKATLPRIMDRCDLVIAPAASIATWLDEYCGFSGAVVIPNGIDIARFAGPSRAVDRRDLGFGERDVVLCYTGRLGPEKNTPLLASEFATAAAAVPGLRLLIVGDGPARAHAESVFADRGVLDRVHFTGMQPYERIPDYLAAADVFVTGSVSEVHPLVVLEAMAAGLPVIGIESPGISDTVEHGVSGLLASAAAPGLLAEQLVRVAGDDRLRADLRRQASSAASAYSLSRTADVVLGHYERLVGRRAT